METKVKISCPGAIFLGSGIIVAGVLAGLIIMAAGLPWAVTLAVMIVCMIGSILVFFLKGTLSANEDGVKIAMPIGSDKLIPYTEITNAELDIAPGVKTGKYSSRRYIEYVLRITTSSGVSEFRVSSLETAEARELKTPAVKAQFLERSAFKYIAGYIRQRSGI